MSSNKTQIPINESINLKEFLVIDDKGNITIRGAVIETITGGSNIKDALNLGEVTERTIMESNNLTYQLGHAADLSTTLKDIGITGNNTLIINGVSNNIAETATLESIKNTLKYISVPKLQNYKSDYFLTLIINF